jgi:general secretion pathway protein L
MATTEFLDWWGAQLRASIPGWLRVPLAGRRQRVGLRFSDRHVELTDVDGQVLGQLELRGTQAPDAAAAQTLRELGGRARQLDVTVPAGHYLLTRLALPEAARSNLVEAVGYQLPKLTPFTSDRAVYACGVDNERAADGRLSVWAVVLPRRPLVTVLAVFGVDAARSTLPLASPPAAGEALRFSIDLAAPGGRRRHGRRLVVAGLAAAWLAAVGLHLHKQQAAREQLAGQLDTVRAQAGAVSQLRARIAERRRQAEVVRERSQDTVSVLAVLDWLSENLDDSTWLQNLEIDGDTLTLRGLSATPAGLIERLEQSDLLREVRFDSAITRNTGESGDRFHISAKLDRPGAGDDA